MTLRIGFIGAGKAGCSFGKYLSVRAVETVKATDTPLLDIAGYYSKSPESSAFASEITSSRQFESLVDIAEFCDLIFITVPDGQISEVLNDLVVEFNKANVDLSHKIFAHLSGSLSSEILLENIDDDFVYDYSVFSLHPACAIPNKTDAWLGLRDAVFVYEGSEKCKSLISPLLDVMGNQIGSIDPDKKTLYHAACVFLSNLGVGLAYEGHDLLTSCGMDNKTADAFLSTLFLGNAKNVAEKGPVEALTGPAERGDVSVIKKHMTELGKLKENSGSKALSIYTELTEILIKIAKEKHPDRDYQDLTDLLK